MNFSDDLSVIQSAYDVNYDPLQIIWIDCELLLWYFMVFPKRWYIFGDLSSATLIYPLKFAHRWLKPVDLLKLSYRALKANSIKSVYWISRTTSF